MYYSFVIYKDVLFGVICFTLDCVVRKQNGLKHIAKLQRTIFKCAFKGNMAITCSQQVRSIIYLL